MRFTIFLASTGILASLLLSACAPRASGVEARRQADERFRRTTSLVSFDQAKQAFETGELDKARKEIEAAIARSDKEAKYWSLLGRIELEAKRLERALTALGKAIENDPKFAEPFYYRGIVHQRWNEPQKAIEDYLKAAELAPEKIAYPLAAAEVMISTRELDEARMLLLPKLAQFEHNAAMHELLGDISFLKGDDAAAARSYERALVIDVEAPLLAEKLVATYFRAGEWQRCLDAARRQRAMAAKDANGRRAEIPSDVYRYEGRSLAMLDRNADARAVFVEQTRAYPEESEAWRDLATASLASGDLSRAEQAADRLVALATNDASGYTLRGLVAEGRGRFDEAVRWHRLAVARNPKSVDALTALGLALERAGKRREGLEVLGQAMKLDPESPVARRAFAGANDD
ncbi:MAG: tetratricopeptide repeat protein [Planctomycetaceae bacterium]|nr:tetratricopeptide repeat protein [Planctomycetaceae bacterium]